jgi:hypothetical protein
MRSLLKRRWFRVVILAGLPVLSLLIVLFIVVAPADRITESSCEKIERGMREAQVEAILGAPGDEVDRSERGRVIHRKWEGRDGSIHVLFRDGVAACEGQFILRMDSTVCGVIRRLFWSIFEESPALRLVSPEGERKSRNTTTRRRSKAKWPVVVFTGRLEQPARRGLSRKDTS